MPRRGCGLALQIRPPKPPIPPPFDSTACYNHLGVLTSSLVLVGGGDDGGEQQLLQTSHELTQPGGAVGGVQMWRMSGCPAGPSVGSDSLSAATEPEQWPVENDEEAFMYSGCQL